jgi:hypothetical protein
VRLFKEGAVSYRPITDTWIMGRPKVKYHGAYPNGFLHRARQLLGVGPTDAVLHICSGRIRDYPCRGFGVNDKTLDIDPLLRPDFCQDARQTLPAGPWRAILIDRPYTADDAEHYATGAATLPEINDLVKRSLLLLQPGECVGVLDYVWPHPGVLGREVAVIGVGTGRNARARWFTVFERLAKPTQEDEANADVEESDRPEQQANSGSGDSRVVPFVAGTAGTIGRKSFFGRVERALRQRVGGQAADRRRA